MTIENQPRGRMTVLALPEHLREEWAAPQEVEVRLGGELVIYGLTTGLHLRRMLTQCANPECEGCTPKEALLLEIEISQPEDP